MTSDRTARKLMAATPAEFARGLDRLAVFFSTQAAGSGTVFDLPGGGTVHVTYTPREGRRLSPLLVMPAADVTFAFTGSTEESYTSFLAKFDQVFQRGGG